MAKDQYKGIVGSYAKAQRDLGEQVGEVVRDIMYPLMGNLSGKLVYDFGCGPGKDVAIMTSMGARAYGVDISRDAVAEAKKSYPNLKRHFNVGDLADFRFLKPADIIFSRFGIDYCPNLDQVFDNVHHNLKSGGALVLAVNHPDLLKYAESITPKELLDKGFVKLPLFGGKFVFEKPIHQMRDYLNKIDRFNLEGFHEGQESPDMSPIPGMPSDTPHFMIMKFRKR